MKIFLFYFASPPFFGGVFIVEALSGHFGDDGAGVGVAACWMHIVLGQTARDRPENEKIPLLLNQIEFGYFGLS